MPRPRAPSLPNLVKIFRNFSNENDYSLHLEPVPGKPPKHPKKPRKRSRSVSSLGPETVLGQSSNSLMEDTPAPVWHEVTKPAEAPLVPPRQHRRYGLTNPDQQLCEQLTHMARRQAIQHIPQFFSPRQQQNQHQFQYHDLEYQAPQHHYNQHHQQQFFTPQPRSRYHDVPLEYYTSSEPTQHRRRHQPEEAEQHTSHEYQQKQHPSMHRWRSPSPERQYPEFKSLDGPLRFTPREPLQEPRRRRTYVRRYYTPQAVRRSSPAPSLQHLLHHRHPRPRFSTPQSQERSRQQQRCRSNSITELPRQMSDLEFTSKEFFFPALRKAEPPVKAASVQYERSAPPIEFIPAAPKFSPPPPFQGDCIRQRMSPPSLLSPTPTPKRKSRFLSTPSPTPVAKGEGRERKSRSPKEGGRIRLHQGCILPLFVRERSTSESPVRFETAEVMSHAQFLFQKSGQFNTREDFAKIDAMREKYRYQNNS